jgi:hypothetical protein
MVSILSQSCDFIYDYTTKVHVEIKSSKCKMFGKVHDIYRNNIIYSYDDQIWVSDNDTGEEYLVYSGIYKFFFIISFNNIGTEICIIFPDQTQENTYIIIVYNIESKESVNKYIYLLDLIKGIIFIENNIFIMFDRDYNIEPDYNIYNLIPYNILNQRILNGKCISSEEHPKFNSLSPFFAHTDNCLIYINFHEDDCRYKIVLDGEIYKINPVMHSLLKIHTDLQKFKFKFDE